MSCAINSDSMVYLSQQEWRSVRDDLFQRTAENKSLRAQQLQKELTPAEHKLETTSSVTADGLTIEETDDSFESTSIADPVFLGFGRCVDDGEVLHAYPRSASYNAFGNPIPLLALIAENELSDLQKRELAAEMVGRQVRGYGGYDAFVLDKTYGCVLLVMNSCAVSSKVLKALEKEESRQNVEAALKDLPVVQDAYHVQKSACEAATPTVIDGYKFTRLSISDTPIYSAALTRCRGLIEMDLLAKKKVAVVGLGAGGAPVVVELAKAGVGNFVLIDFDRVELANINRHVCDLRDLGRRKTLAMRDRVLCINPAANISIHNVDISKLTDEALDALLKGSDLLIAATDNNQSRGILNHSSLRLKIPALYGRVVTRAAGGDIVRAVPSQPGRPCLACVYTDKFMGLEEEITSRRQANRVAPAYMTEEEKNATIQVGLSSDIAPISNFLTKLALCELCRGTASGGLAALDAELQADMYMWVNRREVQFQNFVALNDPKFTKAVATPLRWLPIKVILSKPCLVCRRGFEDDAAQGAAASRSSATGQGIC